MNSENLIINNENVGKDSQCLSKASYVIQDLQIKKQKGITLIALIVTIIIMLILAGVVINLLLSNGGIFEHAKMSKFATDFREVEEKTNLYIMNKESQKILAEIAKENSNIDVFPVTAKLTDEEKEIITKKIPTLKNKMEELTKKSIQQLNICWIDKSKIEVDKNHKYIIDIDTKQIYDYEGEKIYGQMWHTLESGNNIEEEEPRIPGEIYISTNPKAQTIKININIEYEDWKNEKQYKIGANTENWTEYTGEIILTSEEVKNKNLANEDGTITIYAKGKKENGEESVKEKTINNMDLTIIQKPVINIDAYPKLYWNGVKLHTKIDITYEENEELQNYYSLDDGNTWNIYNGTIETINVDKVKAKSVKKSGVEASESKEVDANPGFIGKKSYDGDLATDFYVWYPNTALMEVDESAWNETFKVRVAWYYATIQFLDKDQNVLWGSGYPGYTNGILDFEAKIYENTKYIRLYCYSSSGDGASLVEIQSKQEPEITVASEHLPKLTLNGVENPYNMISVNYSSKITQKLYSLDGKNWEQYNGEVKVEVGKTIYAKGIVENGEETPISSKTVTLPAHSIGSNGYDGNENTDFYIWYPDEAYMEIDESAWKKTLKYNIGWYYGTIGILNQNGEFLYMSGYPGYTDGTLISQVVIPEGSKTLVLFCYSSSGDGAALRNLEIID